MNLVQKLPIGLGLACMMMLSSCSKEDAQTPTPQVGGVNESSNAREGNGGIQLLSATFAPTSGNPGIYVYPAGWERDFSNSSPNMATFPTGTSTLTHLWGNPLVPWKNPLPKLPQMAGTPSILTVTTSNSVFPDFIGDASTVTTKIKNLKPFKKYSITFYVASTIRVDSGEETDRAEKGQVAISFPGHVSVGSVSLVEEAYWSAKTMTFYAYEKEARFTFTAANYNPGQYSYAHIYVDNNSIKQID